MARYVCQWTRLCRTQYRSAVKVSTQLLVTNLPPITVSLCVGCVVLPVQSLKLPPYTSFEQLGVNDKEARAALREVSTNV